MVEAVITRGRRQENFNRPETETIDFRNVSVDVRIAYCNVLLKSMLTEKLVELTNIIYDKYNQKLDLINMVDNICKEIDLSLFVNSNNKDYRICLDNMIYNSVIRAIVYSQTIFPEADLSNFIKRFNINKNEISVNILRILSY